MSLPYDRIYNFSAGPAAMPVSVLEQCRDDLLNYKGTGMSVMEMSHRSAPFERIIEEAEADLRALLSIPNNYRVLFLQGGASLQFSMIPMSFLKAENPAQYVVTGAWGKKAVESANLCGPTEVVFDGGKAYQSVPDWSALSVSSDASYVHVTTNETIQGVEFADDPSSEAPLVADMSSDILSRPVEVGNYALIYAGAQKNMGPAGLTVVIVRDDLFATANLNLPPMLDYGLQAKNKSLYNTPPAWCIYVTGLVYKKLLADGGISAAYRLREEKAKILYDAIDLSEGFYRGHAEMDSRSRMNVTFTLGSDELTSKFVVEAEKKHLDGLPGHRSVGGCRASIYSAFPIEGCQKLAEHMAAFAKANR